MGWITREVLMHGKELAEINTRCHGREEWLRQSVLDVKNLEERLARIDRNLIRVGIVSGVDTGELEKE
jgi:nitric oxide synthase oxygenase domain/subunit